MTSLRHSMSGFNRDRGAVILAICQGLFTAALSIDLTLTGLTGYQLAPEKSLATLPFALITVAGAVVTLSASLLMKKIGRRLGFVLGSLICAAGGLISVWSIYHNNFWIFCLGTATVGVFQAFAQYYRLAAADGVEDRFKAKVISTVLAGSVVAAILGPALAAWSRNIFSVLFAGSYFMVFLLGLASAIILIFAYEDPKSEQTASAAAVLPSRPLLDVLGQPISIAAIANNVIEGAVMMLVMTAAPLAAVSHGYSISSGAGIIQLHLVGMYAPSLFAGFLIRTIGLSRVLFAGMMLSVMCAALSVMCAALSVISTTLPMFYAALLCLGVGWNFMFVGGSTLLAQSHRESEKAHVQGTSEMMRYVLTAIATLAAGPVLEHFGWARLNLLTLPLVLLAAIMTVWWVYADRRPRAATP